MASLRLTLCAVFVVVLMVRIGSSERQSHGLKCLIVICVAVKIHGFHFFYIKKKKKTYKVIN